MKPPKTAVMILKSVSTRVGMMADFHQFVVSNKINSGPLGHLKLNILYEADNTAEQLSRACCYRTMVRMLKRSSRWTGDMMRVAGGGEDRRTNIISKLNRNSEMVKWAWTGGLSNEKLVTNLHEQLTPVSGQGTFLVSRQPRKALRLRNHTGGVLLESWTNIRTERVSSC